MGLYDNVLAQAREAEAMAAINVPAAQATQYGAALGMSRAKQGVNQMFGIEEPAVIQAKAAQAKQAQLNSIVSKYSTASTREDFTAAFSELMANGFPAEAKLMQEHIKNMPAPKGKTDKIQNYEYGKQLPEDQQQEYFDLINPGQVPTSYAEYKRTDDTPTGAEFLAYLKANGKDATLTPQYKNYLNTTDTPSKEGFATFLDRNETKEKFVSAQQAELALLTRDPAFIVKPFEEQQRLLKEIDLRYADIQTFTQNGVVYDAKDNTAMIEGSKEIIPTTIVGGRIYDARTMTLLNDDGVKRVMKQRQDGQWYYEDNGAKVFKGEVVKPNDEKDAAAIYTELGIPNTQAEKVALASRLIQDGLANTEVFANVMRSVDLDSANAIKQENLIVKSIERLSENFVKSGVGEMDTILRPVEQSIAANMKQVQQEDGELVWVGSLPGYGLVKKAVQYTFGEAGYEAREFAGRAATLINSVLKQRSGAAVTEPEWQRLEQEFATGITTAAGFASWVERVRNYTDKVQINIFGGYQPIVVNRYNANQGIYTTLTDMSQINTIPPGGYFKDTEGQIRQRKLQ